MQGAFRAKGTYVYNKNTNKKYFLLERPHGISKKRIESDEFNKEVERVLLKFKKNCKKV